MKKWLSLVLVLCLAASCAAFAGAESEPVEIELVTIWGAPSAGQGAVLEKVNEILLAECNATITFRYLDQPETQYALLFAGGDDDFDLVFSCDWWYYFDYARNGAFLEITEEMIQTYMPRNWANMPAIAWEQSKVDGKIYLVPGNEVVMGERAIIIRGDLREKYGLEPLETKEDLVEYLKVVAENETDILAVSGEMQEQIGHIMGLYQPHSKGITNGVNVAYSDEKTAYLLLDTEEFRQAAYLMKELADAGCWPSDAMASTTANADTDAFYNGTSATFVHNLPTCGGMLKSVNQDFPEYKAELLDMAPERKKSVTNYTGSGTAVNVNAANPEVALQVLDLMMNDQALYDLIMYGIEDVHWQANEDGTYSRALNSELPDEEKYSCSTENWCFYNSNLKRTAEGSDPAYLAMSEAYEANILESELSMFLFDKTPVEAEIAAIENLMDQYVKPIQYGLVSDVDAAIEEAKTMLAIAGIDAVLAEVQSQLDAFWASR